VLDSLLGQGHVPLRAIILAAQECPILQVVASTAEMGGEAVPLLRELGSRPGAAGLLDVARAWEVTERTGAPLHGALARVKVNLAARADLASVIAQELAAPRATSQLLAVLPVVGLGLGYLVGGDPVAFLTATTPGRLCFMAGIALACVGAVWSDALAAKASALSRSPDRTRRWAGLRRRKWVGAAPDGGWSP
jgi:tight adherence protein B